MPYEHFDRLSSTDEVMLALDDENTHMHVGAVAIFDAAPLINADGDFEIDRVRDAIDAATIHIPRFRQKLVHIPVFDRPVWVDDRQFNLFFHVRHTALPHPGSLRKIKRLTGRVMSQKLDPHKPLWEVWVVEGLEDNRFALIVKAHHCMVDGVGGVELLTQILSPDPKAADPKLTEWIPRHVPSDLALFRNEVGRRLSAPWSLATAGWRAITSPIESLETLRDGGSNLIEAVSSMGTGSSPTPIDEATGPYRRVDWLHLDIQGALQIKRAFGGTLNDVVLACAAGAFGRFLRQRGVDTSDLDFRTSIPMNVRDKNGETDIGNHITTLFAALPVDEEDSTRRIEKVIETTREIKSSAEKRGVSDEEGLVGELSDRLFPSLMAEAARLVRDRLQLVNVYISNVPGPRVPVYLLGAKMLEIYPVAPVVHMIAVALFTYDKGLHWGFNADWDLFPDLHALIEFTEEEFEALLKAAAAKSPAA
ncbi:MAG: wax ester/triacylglycerol synthase family O-acyltransferase [Myxococcota bacterium]|jgi:WS/DGAT/MGAT family acyltransferase|nr:wax ester/triacylglycerol synthase family O-acyltransferase [Myxococcota bacterium]